ncbi:MAG: hypothetical protein ACT4OE_07215 [Sphingosinicella sp.]
MLALLLLMTMVSPDPPPATDPCRVDYPAMMGLGHDAFDQDMNGGWRELARRPGCRERAADLIRAYRESRQRGIGSLYWHEGQLRAGLGQNEEAIRLFDRARHPTDEDGWNAYVDATTAFLRGDREGLVAARARLASLPPPPDFRSWRSADGPPPRWPLNLDVVDGLVRCFGRPYAEAYGSLACRAAPGGPLR